MALASSIPLIDPDVVAPAPAQPVGAATERKSAYPAHETLVRAFVERSNGELGWLAWQDGSAPIVVERPPGGLLHPLAIAEFPESPQETLVPQQSGGGG